MTRRPISRPGANNVVLLEQRSANGASMAPPPSRAAQRGSRADIGAHRATGSRRRPRPQKGTEEPFMPAGFAGTTPTLEWIRGFLSSQRAAHPGAGPPMPPRERRRLIRESDRQNYTSHGYRALTSYAFARGIIPGKLLGLIHDQLTEGGGTPKRDAVWVGVHDVDLERGAATVMGEKYSRSAATLGQFLPGDGDRSIEGRRAAPSGTRRGLGPGVCGPIHDRGPGATTRSNGTAQRASTRHRPSGRVCARRGMDRTA